MSNLSKALIPLLIAGTLNFGARVAMGEATNSKNLETKIVLIENSIQIPEQDPNQIAYSTINNILRTQYIGNPDYNTLNPHPSGLDRLLPVAILEPTARGFNPKQIGGGKIIREYVSILIYSAKDYERDAIGDEIYNKVRSVIRAVDYNDAPEILNYEGDRSSSYKTYTAMQSDHFWTNIYIDDMNIIERELLNNMIFMTRIDLLLKIYLNS